jgi:hypothetical protein
MTDRRDKPADRHGPSLLLVILAKCRPEHRSYRATPRETALKDLIDIFLQPGPVLQKQYERPTGWLPVLLLAAASAAFMYLYFSKVDTGWFMRTSVERSGEELSKQQLDAMAAAGDNSSMILWSSTIGGVVGFIIYQCILAVYFLLAGKVTGLAVGFKQGLGLAGWSSMPVLLGTVLGLYGTVGMSPQTYIDALSFTTVDPMVLQLPPESPWKGLATTFSFLTLWTIGLAALGWKLWSRSSSWTTPIVVAALPQLLIVGFQAVKALMA